LIQYSVLSIIQGNGADGVARIIEKHGSFKTIEPQTRNKTVIDLFYT
jgi:hypothetical protein